MEPKKTGRPRIDDDLKRKKVTISLAPDEHAALQEVARLRRKSQGLVVGETMLRELARERKKHGK